jgi:lipoyl(octanoyl) transferase
MLVRALGLKEYTEVWRLQKELVAQRLSGEIGDTLLLVEHLPVYTIGEASRAVVPCFLPHPAYQVERGGDITYHGPGQLVGYPILSLAKNNLKPRTYLRALEGVLIEALKTLGVEAGTIKGFTGVWAGGKKIASIGVAVRGDVSYHGFALNVNCDLEPFYSINPCNLEADEMTTVQKVLGKPVDSIKVMRQVAETFLAYFGRLEPVAR